MNELIERLMMEAGPGASCCTPQWIEAFAKLVARECVEIARTTENPFSVSRVIREKFELPKVNTESKASTNR